MLQKQSFLLLLALFCKGRNRISVWTLSSGRVGNRLLWKLRGTELFELLKKTLQPSILHFQRVLVFTESKYEIVVWVLGDVFRQYYVRSLLWRQLTEFFEKEGL